MGKAERKIGQASRREARVAMATYQKALIEKLTVFNQVLKPRPKFVPRFVWTFLANRFIDVSKLESIFNGK